MPASRAGKIFGAAATASTDLTAVVLGLALRERSL